MGKWSGDVAAAASKPLERDEWRAATAPVIGAADRRQEGLESNRSSLAISLASQSNGKWISGWISRRTPLIALQRLAGGGCRLA